MTGPVAGRPIAHGTVFHSIPYAAPPVGAHRFAAPRPHEPWTAVRDATRPGPTAPQPVRDTFGNLDMSPYFGPGWRRGADYLTADIWAPAHGPAPVLVFLEDTTGKGHITNLLTEVSNIFIVVEPDFDFDTWAKGA